MHSIVCVKEIPDPETPASAFAIDPVAKRAIPAKDKPPVISPFDEQAVEAALRLKDAKGGKVTVISMGAPTAEKILKHSLAMGADEAVLLNDPAFEDSDSFSTAYVLALAIKKKLSESSNAGSLSKIASSAPIARLCFNIFSAVGAPMLMTVTLPPLASF